MSRTHREREDVFAVLRRDAYDDGEISVTVKEVVRSRALAEAEVARLNDLNRDKSARYEWQMTRLFPDGESAGTKSPESGDAADRTGG